VKLSLTSGIVRTTRARIIRLKNDYKEVMSLIEKGLHAHHARMAEQAQSNPQAANNAPPGLEPAPAPLEAPFAKVNSVVSGSPAEEAGLRVGDTITKFGWVNWTNHERLSRVAEAVAQNEGVSADEALGPRYQMLTAHSSRSQSRHCDPAHQAGQRRRCRCSSHHGETGAAAACWAATCCRYSLCACNDL
jgi:hypothetical protein